MVGKKYLQFVQDSYKLRGKEEGADYLILGLLSEVGEVADLFKRALIDGKKVDKVATLKELGDVAWYSTAIASLSRPPSQLAKVIDSILLAEPSFLESVKKAINSKDFLYIYSLLVDIESDASLIKAPIKYRKRLEILAGLAEAFGSSLHTILEGNMSKLKKRAKNGGKKK